MKTSSVQGTHLKSAASVFKQGLFMMVNAMSALNLHVCEDHIPSNETGTNWKYYVVS